MSLVCRSMASADKDEHADEDADAGGNVLDDILGGSDDDEAEERPESALSSRAKKDAYVSVSPVARGNASAGAKPRNFGETLATESEQSRHLGRTGEGDRPVTQQRGSELDRRREHDKREHGAWERENYMGGAPRFEMNPSLDRARDGNCPSALREAQGGARRENDERDLRGRERDDFRDPAPRFEAYPPPVRQDGGPWTAEPPERQQHLHRVLVTGIQGGDYWLDQRVLRTVFAQYGRVVDVFLPKANKMAFIAFEEAEMLEHVLSLKELVIESCTVRLTRAAQKGQDKKGGQNRPMQRPGGPGASGPPMPPLRRGESAGMPPDLSPHTRSPPRNNRFPPPRGAEGVSGNPHDSLGKRQRGPESHDGGPAVSSPRVMCGVGMNLEEPTAWSNGCCVVGEIKEGGPVDRSGMVRLGDLLVQVNDKSCVGIARKIIKTYVLGPEFSQVELVFERDKQRFGVLLQRVAHVAQAKAAPSTNANAALPPPSMPQHLHPDDMHKRQRMEPQRQLSEMRTDGEMLSPRGGPPMREQDERDNRRPIRPVNPLPRQPLPLREWEAPGGGARSARDGWDHREFGPTDGSRERRDGPRDQRDLNDGGPPARDNREHWAGPPGDRGMGPMDDRRYGQPMVGDGVYGRREVFGADDAMLHGRRNAGNMPRDSPRMDSRPGPQRGRSRSRTPPRGGGMPYPNDRGPPGDFRRRSRSPEPTYGGPMRPGGPGGPQGPQGLQEKRNPNFQRNRIFLSAITGGTRWLNKDSIRQVMQQFGNVLQVFIPHGKKFAYVSFDHGESKDAVMNAGDIIIDGCTVKCDSAKAHGTAPESDRFSSSPAHDYNRQPSFAHEYNRQPSFAREYNRQSFIAHEHDRRHWGSLQGDRHKHVARDVRRDVISEGDSYYHCAQDVRMSHPTEEDLERSNPGQRISSHSFSHCKPLVSSSVGQRKRDSELIVNLTAGNSGEPLMHVTHDESAGEHFMTLASLDESPRMQIHSHRRDEAAGFSPLVSSRLSGNSPNEFANQGDLMIKENRLGLGPEPRRSGRGTSVGRSVPVCSHNTAEGQRAAPKQETEMRVDGGRCLIKPQPMDASLQGLMDWHDSSLDSLSLNDLVYSLIRFSSLLAPHLDFDNLNIEADASHESSFPQRQSPLDLVLRMLRQCLDLLPAVVQRFLALSHISHCGANDVPFAECQQASHYSCTGTDGIDKVRGRQCSVSRMCAVRNDNSVDSISGSLARAAQDIRHCALDRVPGSAGGELTVMLNARLVRITCVSLAQVYSAALQHCYAHRTQLLAREVCACCQDALLRVCGCVSAHLEKAATCRDSQLSTHNAYQGFCSSDVLHVLRAIAILTDNVNTVGQAAHENGVAKVVTQLRDLLYSVGHWLVLMFVSATPPLPSSASASMQAPALAAPVAIAASSLHVAASHESHDDAKPETAASFLTLEESLQVLFSFGPTYVFGMPPPQIWALLDLPPGLSKDAHTPEPKARVHSYVERLDAGQVYQLLVTVGRFPLELQEQVVAVVTALVDKALKKRLYSAMSHSQLVDLLSAYPFLRTEAFVPQHKTQALRLFRAVVERLRDVCHLLHAQHLARIAQAHVLNWQGMDTIGASMSQQLFALTGTTEPRAQDALDSATANEIGRDGNGGRRTDSTCSWPSVVGTGGLTLKETTDLLLGFTLMGMHQEGLCGRRVMRALMSIALQICDNVKSFIEYCVPTKTIVQLLWAMSVADSLCTPEVHETQGKGASFIADSSGAAAAAEQMLEHVTRLGSRLLVIIVRRWWGGTLSLSASAVSRSSAAATPEVLDDVDAEMLLQVYQMVGCSNGGAEVQGLVKELKRLGRERDCSRHAQTCDILDDMQRVLLALRAPGRRAVEVGDGGCVVSFVLERDGAESAENSPEYDCSPAPSASTELLAGSSISGYRPMNRALSNDRDLCESSLTSTARPPASAAADAPELIEVYHARNDCLQRPSELGVAFLPAGLWLNRMRLLRRQRFAVLQVGSEQWDGLLRAEFKNGAQGNREVEVGREGGLAAVGRSLRAEWLMKLINTASWARNLDLSGGLGRGHEHSGGDVSMASVVLEARPDMKEGSDEVGGSSVACPLSPRDSLNDSLSDFNLGESASSFLHHRT